jgi:hypothetical protein
MTNITRVVAVTILGLTVLRVQGSTQEVGSHQSGDGDVHRSDPCLLAPDPQGRASGPEKHCAPGASGGVGRGDFNNDGIADLAVGVPDQTRQSQIFDPECSCIRITNHQGAGTVNIIYGGTAGLTTTGSQVLGQSNLAIKTNAHFGKALAAGKFRGSTFASDLAVAVPGADNGGSIDVFFSSSGKLNSTPNQRLFAQSFSTAGTSLGLVVTQGVLVFPQDLTMVWGDFNGDAVGDLAAEVMNENGGRETPGARCWFCTGLQGRDSAYRIPPCWW